VNEEQGKKTANGQTGTEKERLHVVSTRRWREEIGYFELI
jgi:hypothetical protein